MATTYTPLGALADSVEVVGTEVRLKALVPVNTTVTGTIRQNTDGVITDIPATFKSVPKVREVRKVRGGRAAVVPQRFYDAMAVDAADPNTHPHLGTADVTAVKDGVWSDPTLWSTGVVPTEGQKVNTSTFDVTYDIESNVKVASIHVSGAGTLRFADDRDTRLWVDTILCHGTLIAGEPGNPIAESATLGKSRCEIVFWQSQAPLTTVRLGLMTMGPVRMQGAEKAHWLRANAPILAGATSVTLSDVATSGWRVGDTILFAATEKSGTGITATDAQYAGPTQFYGPFNNADGVRTRTLGYPISTDEERVITSIVGNVVSWSGGLSFDHKLYSGTLPRGQAITLNPIVANKSRSIQLRTAGGKAGDAAIWAGADLTERQKRAHAMFMFSDDIQIRGVRFLDMGRTDQNPSLVAPVARINAGAVEVSNFLAYDKAPGDGSRVVITDANNVRGRYPLHVHGTGAYFGRRMVVVEDCVTDTSPGAPPIPGWAIVHHNSRAAFERCIAHNVRGAGMVSELGNETGQWVDNLICGVRGDGYDTGFGSRAEFWQNHNGHYGVAFENQARQVLLKGNHATSAHKGYGYFQQFAAFQLREPDVLSLRMMDPIAKGNGDWVALNSEQAQIPDFTDNTFANCTNGFYIEHRLNDLERNDETPMLIHGFHGVNTNTPFNIANYSQHYYVYDSFWDGFTTGASIGSVANGFMFVNMEIRNGSLGISAGNNYNGFIIDVNTTNVTTPFGDDVMAITTANEDVTQNTYYNMMDQWVVTNNDSPSPGYTVRVRTGRSLNSLTDLPQPYPSLPLGRKMPDGSPAVPLGSDPYFLLDTGVSTLTLNGSGGSSVVVAGTLRDSVGDRRFGDYQNPETPFANHSVKTGRILTGTTPEQVVLRNGCYLDGATWKTRLWFIYADRATGEYFFPSVDLTLTGFATPFLEANVVDPNSTKPMLPMLPELVREGPYVPNLTAPFVTSATPVSVPLGLTLAHVLKADNGQVKWSIVGGADAALFEIITASGVSTLRRVGDATQATVRAFSLTIRVTDQFGNFRDVPHTVNAEARFTDNFTGTASQNLEARTGWTLLSGTAGGLRLNSTGTTLIRNAESFYRSLDFGATNHGVKIKILSGNGTGNVIIRRTVDGSFVSVNRNGNDVILQYWNAGVNQGQIASSNLTAAEWLGVLQTEAVGDQLTIKIGGVTKITRTLPAYLLTGTIHGLGTFFAGPGDWVDDYEAYAL